MPNGYFQNRLRYFDLLAIVMVIFLLLADNAVGLRCYVCGPEESFTDCDKFTHLNQNLYAKECPPDSQSCTSIRIEDSIKGMACETKKIDDCKLMNHTEYCYCIFDLCNGNKSIKTSITISTTDLNDDEDFIEGSGYNQIFPSTGSTVSTRYSTIHPPNTGSNYLETNCFAKDEYLAEDGFVERQHRRCNRIIY